MCDTASATSKGSFVNIGRMAKSICNAIVKDDLEFINNSYENGYMFVQNQFNLAFEYKRYRVLRFFIMISSEAFHAKYGVVRPLINPSKDLGLLFRAIEHCDVNMVNILLLDHHTKQKFNNNNFLMVAIDKDLESGKIIEGGLVDGLLLSRFNSSICEIIAMGSNTLKN